MRICASLISLLAAAAAIAATMAASGGAAPHPALLADRSPGAVAVDVELVLGVDVSYSMDLEEQALQRQGYIHGLTSRESTQSAFSRVSFKVTDNVELFAQALWAHNQNHNWCCAREDNATITIKSDNAFIPADVKSRMTTLGLTQFTFGTMKSYGISTGISFRVW